MPFDPDAFLAPATKGAFDPDAFLGKVPAPASKPAPSAWDDFKTGLQHLNAPLEVLTNLGSGAVGQAVGGLAGSVRAMFPGKEGVGAETSQKVAEALTYLPRSEVAKKTLGVVGEGLEYANTKLGEAGGAVGGEVGRSIGESALPVAMTVAPVPKLARSFKANPTLTLKAPSTMPGFQTETGEVISGKDVGYARDNAAKLEAHELAMKHGIVTDPSVTNPTRLNRMAVEQAGPGDVAAKLATTNEPKWNKIVASDPDIDIRAPLSIENIKAVRERAAEPSLEIARIGSDPLPVADFHLEQLNKLYVKRGIVNPGEADAVNGVINRAVEHTVNGMTSAKALEQISHLREAARRNFNNANATLSDIAEAKVSMKIANIIEDMIDTHLFDLAERNPYGGFAELGDAYRQGRRTMAKSYALEDAFDANTRQIDPNKIAKMTATDNALTGNFADVGKIAGALPEVAELGARTRPLMDTRLSRYGVSGLAGSGVGGLLGMMTGNPAVAASGMGVGGLAGALGGEVLSRVLRNKVVNPEVQARGVTQVPRSMWDLSDVDPLAARPKPPPEIRREFNRPPDGQPPMLPAPEVPPPAGPRGPVEGAPAPYRHPNFQFGENNPPQPRPPGTDVVPGRPLTPQEQWAQDKANFTAQDRTRYNREATLDELARQKAEAEAAALRQPASRERALNLNPMTGRLEPVSRGLPGATPETIRSTGSALERAVQKISEGRAFDLTLEEKVAWKHTQNSFTDALRKKE